MRRALSRFFPDRALHISRGFAKLPNLTPEQLIESSAALVQKVGMSKSRLRNHADF
jgi:hypothetical protein